MEPDYDFGRELQAYARVNRIGQKNSQTRSFRLVNAHNGVEGRIVARQVERGEDMGRRVLGAVWWPGRWDVDRPSRQDWVDAEDKEKRRKVDVEKALDAARRAVEEAEEEEEEEERSQLPKKDKGKSRQAIVEDGVESPEVPRTGKRKSKQATVEEGGYSPEIPRRRGPNVATVEEEEGDTTPTPTQRFGDLSGEGVGRWMCGARRVGVTDLKDPRRRT